MTKQMILRHKALRIATVSILLFNVSRVSSQDTWAWADSNALFKTSVHVEIVDGNNISIAKTYFIVQNLSGDQMLWVPLSNLVQIGTDSIHVRNNLNLVGDKPRLRAYTYYSDRNGKNMFGTAIADTMIGISPRSNITLCFIDTIADFDKSGLVLNLNFIAKDSGYNSFTPIPLLDRQFILGTDYYELIVHSIHCTYSPKRKEWDIFVKKSD